MMMWDAPLYDVNMFYYHWLVRNLLYPMAWKNIVRWKSQTEYWEKEGGVKGDRYTIF